MVILVCDDDQGICLGLKALFGKNHDVTLCGDGSQAFELLSKRTFDLVITDVHMPGFTGLELIEKGKALNPSTAFVLMTAFGSIEQSMQAIKMGADDYLMKPFDFSELMYRVQRIEDLRTWHVENSLKVEAGLGITRLIGNSAASKEIKKFVIQVASVDSPVLLLGPTGSGKEMVARAVHEAGPHSNRPFIAVNCASLSEQLMESELFGHEKGAFTGASAAKQGKFELAKGGTIFLDELGELSQNLQAKLLRVLQEKEFYRVGGVRLVQTDARVIAATHRPLKDMVKSGAFREDLFFRFNVLFIELPPLSQRREDIPDLLQYFLGNLCKRLGKKVTLTKETVSMLMTYAYPGNIRELHNILERLIVLAPANSEIGAWALPKEFQAGNGSSVTSLNTVPGGGAVNLADLGKAGLTEAVEAFEARLIAAALTESKNNRAQAARLLKLDRGVLRYKIKKYGLDDSESVEDAA